MNTKSFNVKVGDKTLNLSVVSPSLNDQKEAGKVYNNAFTDALKSKAIVRAKLDDLLAEQGLWDENKQQEFNRLQNEILAGERKLAKGGIGLAEAKGTAMEMKRHREELRELISVRTNLDNHTAEGQADNAKFNYLVYACTVHSDNHSKKYFDSYQDYMNKSTSPEAISAAQNLANMIYGLEENYDAKLPENKFLKNYKFVDEKLRLINKEGKLVDSEGRLVDENGRYINEQGEFIDKEGNRVDENGEYIVEFTPFLDEDGNPVVSAETTKESENKTDDKVESEA
jgi:hypothetical protein